MRTPCSVRCQICNEKLDHDNTCGDSGICYCCTTGSLEESYKPTYMNRYVNYISSDDSLWNEAKYERQKRWSR